MRMFVVVFLLGFGCFAILSGEFLLGVVVFLAAILIGVITS